MKDIITNAQYSSQDGKTNDSILCSINGKVLSVPLVEGNNEYDQIMKQVKEGTLTIKDAD
jgi:hypothetical protein